MRTFDLGYRQQGPKSLAQRMKDGEPIKETGTTDSVLFVRTSSDDISQWDKSRIYEALVKETSISPDAARIVSTEVERMIQELQVEIITAPLIRELTNAKLLEYGLEDVRRQHTRLGVPLFDVRNLITSKNKENANVPHNPEATNLTLAEQIKKEYALMEVFSLDVGDAHMRGDIHLHDLGMIDRPYCSGQSIEYVKKFGLNLPNAMSVARPAKHPEVLIGQLIKFSAALQGSFAGAIGWDAVNLFMAPYLEKCDEKQLKQLSQLLIYEYAQQAVARGGQSIFSDLNLYWEVPKHFAEVEAIGPGGEYTGRTYADYLPASQRFVTSLFKVYEAGDANKRPFFFPKPNVHITDRFFQTDGHQDFMDLICKVAAEKGNTYFVFDRGDTAKISECCRLAFKLESGDLEDAKTPWKMRYSAMQNVTVNLPRIAYEANGDDTLLFEKIRERVELAARAHQQKKVFISKLLSLGTNGPLSLLAMDTDGEPYYRLYRASFLLGVLGLNEMVRYHLGSELHESREVFKFGLKVIAQMKKDTEDMYDLYGVKMPLEQTPGESTAYRFARLDRKYYPMESSSVLRGDGSQGNVYYTNSTYYNVSVPMSPIDRVKGEGKYHNMIEAGALTHVWMGDALPSAASLGNFVKKTFTNTQNAQICFSPEFTSCMSCGRTLRGLHKVCPVCGELRVDGVSRAD